MKKAFTLIELLIVVAVLVTLMGLVFKLGAIGGESYKRTRTITRMQKLENCLSGYNAAFGSYPPVKVHGSRDIYYRVGGHGIQTDQRNEGIWGWNVDRFLAGKYQQAEANAWDQVRAACLAQPVACRYPFPEGYSDYIEAISKEMKYRANSNDPHFKAYYENETVRKRLVEGFDDGVTHNIGRHNKNKDKADWRNIQLFKFGVMSFILPRYIVMMNGDATFFDEYEQWKSNNDLPSDPYTGDQYNDWSDLRGEFANGGSTSTRGISKIVNIPSQAVCARWMPNLSGSCRANHGYTLFGIGIRDESQYGDLSADNPYIEIFSPGDAASGSNAQQYILDGVTMLDGWGNEFYYYSPSPYQRYILWSGGPNERTFPPWIPRKNLSSAANKCVGAWTRDDIIHMSN